MAHRQRRSWWRLSGLALLVGLVLALGHAPFNFPWAVLPALGALMLLIGAGAGFWRGFGIGWVAGLGYFAATLHWLVEPFLIEPEITGWMAPFALVLMAGGLALFWGAGLGLGAWLAARRGPALSVALMAASLTLAELGRAWMFTGFPWALIGQVWVGTPAAQTVALVGVPGLGLLSLLAGGWLFYRRTIAAALVIVAAVWGHGLWRQGTPVVDTGTIVRLVQPNAAQHLKWDADHYLEFFYRQIDFSAAPPALPDAPRPHIVIWPEAATPFLPQEDDVFRERVAQAAGVPVIMGARRREDDNWFNSLFVIGQDAALLASYDKYRLVPFGEYMPLRPVADALGLSGLAELAGRTAHGPGAQLIALPGMPAFVPLICYEAIFARGLRGLTRADWLVQVTNDAWFGTWGGPAQHLAQAQLRAIEQGLPLARSANTGISAMIDPLGRVTIALPLGLGGFVDAPLPAPLAAPPYARWGEWPVLGLIGLIGLLALSGGRLSLPHRLRRIFGRGRGVRY